MLQRKALSDQKMVEHKELLISTIDNKELFTQYWLSVPKTLGCIVLVHGLGEHSSRYDEWAKKFAENGFSVVAFDMRGHGRTKQHVKDAVNYEKMLSDITPLIHKSKELCPGVPTFLYGHSMGGNFVANYAISKHEDINGIVLTSPWLELANVPPGYMLTVAKLLSFFAPKLLVSNRLKSEHISKELREVHLYKKDPLVHDKISVRLFFQAYNRGILAKRSIYRINVPLLLVHGTGDKITSCQASQDFVMNSGENTTMVEIENGYHELHNDSDREKTFSVILNWLKDRV